MQEHPRFHNRIAAVMEHITHYYFQGQARLAADAGVSRSALSRLIAGKTAPSFAVAVAVTAALEKRLGRTLDPRELVSFDGRFPTASVCALCGCKGCMPYAAYDDDDRVRPEYRGITRRDSLPDGIHATVWPQKGAPMD